MTSSRRRGVENSETRSQLLDTAAQIMMHDGYAAVSVRQIAAHMGVSFQLVHYYFRTMDDLFIAMLHREADNTMRQLDEAFNSPEPLPALWSLYSDAEFAQLSSEFLGLIHHRKKIREEATKLSKRVRRFEAQGLSRILMVRGADMKAFPAAGMAILLQSISRAIIHEKGMGFSDGHRDAMAVVNTIITLLGRRKETSSIYKPDRRNKPLSTPRRLTTKSRKKVARR